MRAMAADALDGIGDESAASAMAAAASDEAWQVRLAAVRYIGMLHDPKYQVLLERALADRHIAVRVAAAEVIGTISDQ
jgi:HEAT repeat protein